MATAETLEEYLAEVPQEVQGRFREIVAITDRFCERRLNDEYREVCRRLLTCLCQPDSRVQRGKPQSWAAGVVYEVGQVNFLTDPSFEPFVKSEEIAKGCGVSVATMHNKGRDIREAFGLTQLDVDFVVPSRLQDNPLVWMMELPNGMIVDLRNLPAELRNQLDAAGLLPSTAEPPNVGDWRERKLGSPQEPVGKPGVAYQLKITLDSIKPPIWRRVLVPDCTLADLHEVIQVAMGWEEAHMHEFVIGQRRFQTPPPFGDGVLMEGVEPAEQLLLSEVVPDSPKKRFQFSYVYDFGDDWEHTITVEKVEQTDEAPVKPVCLAGERGCPPEDCGGPWGYGDLLEALADRKHPDHEDMMEWCGPIDPEAFDLDGVNEVFQRWQTSGSSVS